MHKPQTMKLILAFALTTGAAAFTAPHFTVRITPSSVI
jgi:hypothetical protein